MDKTPNYKLNKPAQTDFYDVDDFNENMDIVDAKLKVLDTQSTTAEGALGGLTTRVGTAEGKISAIEEALPNKADLVSGKVPASQLPPPPSILDVLAIGEIFSSVLTDYDDRALLCNGDLIDQNGYPILYALRAVTPGNPWIQNNQAWTTTSPRISFVNGKFIIAIGSAKLYAEDPSTEVWSNNPTSGSASIRVFHDGTYYVAPYPVSTGGVFYYTTDISLPWSATTPVNTMTYIAAAVYADGYYVAIGSSLPAGPFYIKYATNINGPWTDVIIPGGIDGTMNDIVKCGDYWVASGGNGRLFYKQGNPDGTWTQLNVTTLAITRIGYVNGYIVLCCLGRIFYTTDPAGTWTERTITTSGGVNYITYGAGFYVICTSGAAQNIQYATDIAGPWTINAQGAMNMLDVVFGNDTFVAVGGSAGSVFFIDVVEPRTPVISVGAYTYMKGRD